MLDRSLSLGLVVERIRVVVVSVPVTNVICPPPLVLPRTSGPYINTSNGKYRVLQ